MDIGWMDNGRIMDGYWMDGYQMDIGWMDLQTNESINELCVTFLPAQDDIAEKGT